MSQAAGDFSLLRTGSALVSSDTSGSVSKVTQPWKSRENSLLHQLESNSHAYTRYFIIYDPRSDSSPHNNSRATREHRF